MGLQKQLRYLTAAVLLVGACLAMACGDMSAADEKAMKADDHFRAGMAAFEGKDYAKAREELMAAVKMDPGNWKAANALDWVNQLIKGEALADAAGLDEEHSAETADGDSAAMVAPELITSTEPFEFWAAYAAGIEFWKLGDYEAMLDAADEAMQWLSPDSPLYDQVARGQLMALVLNDYYDEASWAVSDLLDSYPDDPQLLNIATMTYERAGYVDDAVWAAEQAYNLAPEDWNSQNNLAYTYAVAGQDLDYAYQLASNALAAEPNNAAYLDTMAWVLYQSGNPEEALQHIQQAMQLTVNRSDREEIVAHYNAIRGALN